jgi:hypothetical protein
MPKSKQQNGKKKKRQRKANQTGEKKDSSKQNASFQVIHSFAKQLSRTSKRWRSPRTKEKRGERTLDAPNQLNDAAAAIECDSADAAYAGGYRRTAPQSKARQKVPDKEKRREEKRRERRELVPTTVGVNH